MADELLPPNAVNDRGLFDPAYIAALRQRQPNKPYSRERMYRPPSPDHERTL
jgi:hypothetical protein